MKLTEQKLKEIIRKELQNAVKEEKLDEDFGMSARQLPSFSSKTIKSDCGSSEIFSSSGLVEAPSLYWHFGHSRLVLPEVFFNLMSQLGQNFI